MLAAFDENMLLPQPDEQRADGSAERPQKGGLHPAELPDAVEITGDKTRFGIVGGGGLLKRGRLSSLRVRDRIHGGAMVVANINEVRPRALTKIPPTLIPPGRAASTPDTRRRVHR